MKQAEVPNNREGIKKELNSGLDISDDPGTVSVRVLETRPEVDKEEGSKDTAEVDKDTLKQTDRWATTIQEKLGFTKTGSSPSTGSPR
jgi:hypothetical protein